MKKYCYNCSYPIWVENNRCHDTSETVTKTVPISHCPGCGEWLYPKELLENPVEDIMIKWENVNNWETIDDGQAILAYTRGYEFVIGDKDGDWIKDKSGDIYLREDITYFVILEPPDWEA